MEEAGASLVRHMARGCMHIVGSMEQVGSRRAGRMALENHVTCDLEAEGMSMDMDMGIGLGVGGIGPRRPPEEEGLKLNARYVQNLPGEEKIWKNFEQESVHTRQITPLSAPNGQE